MSQRYYFAYGSNCNRRQMTERCPHAQHLGTAILEDYQLEFRGDATIRPQKGAKLEGVLWTITPSCEERLDEYEEFPSLYRKEELSLFHKEKGQLQGMVYVMIVETGREYAPPEEDYYHEIRIGLEEHGIDQEMFQKAVAESHDRAGHLHFLP